MDIGHALTELERAKEELVDVEAQHESAKHRKQALLSMPLSRISLVKRYCEQMLARHGWRST